MNTEKIASLPEEAVDEASPCQASCNGMKVLLAVDGSAGSRTAVEEVCGRPWPPGTEIKVFGVAHVRTPEVFDPALLMASLHEEGMLRAHAYVTKVARDAHAYIRDQAPGLQVTLATTEGVPKDQIVEEAERWGADLIVVGSHGYGALKRFVLGSVATAVALHAPCSVEIVRHREPN
jgi:nucleotide-binding universal stress UspA family protein